MPKYPVTGMSYYDVFLAFITSHIPDLKSSQEMKLHYKEAIPNLNRSRMIWKIAGVHFVLIFAKFQDSYVMCGQDPAELQFRP